MEVRPYVHDYREFESYKASDEWFDKFKPQADYSYALPYEFALKKWEDVQAARDSIGDKADKLVRIFGAFVAATITALKFADITPNGQQALLASLVATCLALALALFTRMGVKWPGPMDVSDSLEKLSPDREFQEARIAASLHVAIAGTVSHVAQKSKIMDCSIVLAVVAVALVAVAFCV